MSDPQFESDKILGLVISGNNAMVLFEDAGDVPLLSLPVGLQEKVRLVYSQSDYDALKRTWHEFELRIQAQDGDSAAMELLDELRWRADQESWGAVPSFDLDALLQGRVHYIPNWFKKGDPVPYMPGAGEPLLNRVEKPKGRMILIEER